MRAGTWSVMLSESGKHVFRARSVELSAGLTMTVEFVEATDGVDVASGIEGPDGFKDAGRVRAFVQAVRSSCG